MAGLYYDEYWAMWTDGSGNYYYDDGSFAGYEDPDSGEWYQGGGEYYGGGGGYVDPPPFEADDPWLSYQDVTNIPGYDPSLIAPPNLLVLPADWKYGFDPSNPDLSVPSFQENPSGSFWDKLKKIGSKALEVAGALAGGLKMGASAGGGAPGGGTTGGGGIRPGSGGGILGAASSIPWIPIAAVGAGVFLLTRKKK